MGKRKKGRPRGKSSQLNGNQRNRPRNTKDRPKQRENDLNDGAEPGPVEPGSGILELHPNGYGFLRDPNANYIRQMTDPFVPGSMIEKFHLREGLLINGMVQPGRRQQGPRVKEITDIDGMKPEEYCNVKTFDELTPINPENWLQLETGPEPITTRVMDLLTPLGKGQRALIVAPPRTGKTIMLQQISQAITRKSSGNPTGCTAHRRTARRSYRYEKGR